jgi:MYXO-CTERM domain-containing protein
MKIFASVIALSLVATPLFAACTSMQSAPMGESDTDPDDDQDSHEAVGTTSEAVTRYCGGMHSKSTANMYGPALAAFKAAKVPLGEITQTVGDAPASKGTHCPEPGKKYSAATDLRQGSSPCARTHALRMQGFAAWYRTAPEFPGNNHIHAVYAGTPGIKASLAKQIDSFLAGRDALLGNKIDAHCPISQAEKDAVRLGRACKTNADCVAKSPGKSLCDVPTGLCKVDPDAGVDAGSEAGTETSPVDDGTTNPGESTEPAPAPTDPSASSGGPDAEAGEELPSDAPGEQGPPPPADDGGCSVTTPGRATTGLFGAMAVLGLALFRRRRKA